MMGKTCGKLSGAAVLVAGLAMIAGAAGYANANTATIVAGVFLAVYGLSKIMHKMGCCGMCRAEEPAHPAARRK